MSSTFYDIMLIVGGVLLYSIIVYLGYRHSLNEHKRAIWLVTTLKEVIEEIKHIYKEDKGMEKIKMEKGFAFIGDSEPLEVKEPVNELTLSGLLNRKPTDEEYREIIGLLARLAKQTYGEYKFLIAKSTDETMEPNFMQIISNSKENPSLHKLIFAKALQYGIDMKELQRRFAAHVALNQVIDLGEDVVVIIEDGSPQLATGVSPINNGLEGGEICFIISFMKNENYPVWHRNTFPSQYEEKADE